MTRETQTPATNGINCLLPVMLPAVFSFPLSVLVLVGCHILNMCFGCNETVGYQNLPSLFGGLKPMHMHASEMCVCGAP